MAGNTGVVWQHVGRKSVKRGDLVKHLGDWAVGKLVIGVIVKSLNGIYFDVMWPNGITRMTSHEYLELVHEDR